ncbi:protein of unknown function [Pedobacter steynii]|uniref:DUF4407 domain-containing protein n=2 Tax=Pedobacter steynii TaxID=430522 RepID=A0A1G9LGD1_9SPHI|nr:protein of unknown function [Pedobacter steynii]
MSGCEIRILKECPTDYNRQAGIGFTIFMTTLFGVFAGGYAGYYFTENFMTASIFGLIWGLLVFSIDRTLVVTLKKNPTKTKQAILLPLLGRGVLALLIAFIISIPLELLIFSDQIAIQREFDQEKGKSDIMKISKENGNIGDKREAAVEAERLENEALEDSKNCASDAEFRSIRSAFDTKSAEFRQVNGRYKRVREKLAKLRNIDDNGYMANLFLSGREYRVVEGSYNVLKQQKDVLFQRMSQRCRIYSIEKQKLADLQRNLRTKKMAEIQSVNEESEQKGDKVKRMYTKSFIRDFVALENAAYATEPRKNDKEPLKYTNESLLSFLWLIRVLFFIIEILPTVAKIATPIGAYDRAIYAREKDFELLLELKTADYLAHERELRNIEEEEKVRKQKARAKIEGELHDELLREIALAQNEIGRKKIEAFKKAHQVHVD